MPTKDVVKNFAAKTSLAGMPKIFHSSSRIARYLWALVCVLAITVLITQFVFIIQRYFSYEKKVTVENIGEPMPFPDITLCNMRNLNPVVLNTLNDMFLRDNQPEHHLNTSEDPFIEEYLKTVSRYSPLFYKYLSDLRYQGIIDEIFTRTSVAANLDPFMIAGSAGIQKEEFMVSCKFGHRKCDMNEEIFNFFDPYYFSCYSFRSIASRNESEHELVEGIESGFSTIVYTGNGAVKKNEDIRIIPGLHETGSKLSGSEGVRVIIHPPGTYPYPVTEGFDVPPGFSASFGIQPLRTKRLGHPYGKCKEKLTFGNRTAPWVYRLIDCQNLALQATIIKECGCSDVSLPRLPDVEYQPCRKNDHFPDECMFNATDECLNLTIEIHKKIECIKRVRQNIIKDASILEAYECFHPCEEVAYDVSYSLSKWPAIGLEGDSAYAEIFGTENFKLRFKDEMMLSYFNISNRENVLQDFARINIYVAHSHVFVTEEQPDYTLTQMFSDIGGQLGLWVGVSLLTALELVELFLDVMHNLFNNEKNGRKKSTQNKDKVNDAPAEMSLMEADSNANV